METDERVAALEAKIAEHDRLIARLIAVAKLTPAGRVVLKAAGLS